MKKDRSQVYLTIGRKKFLEITSFCVFISYEVKA